VVCAGADEVSTVDQANATTMMAFVDMVAAPFSMALLAYRVARAEVPEVSVNYFQRSGPTSIRGRAGGSETRGRVLAEQLASGIRARVRTVPSSIAQVRRAAPMGRAPLNPARYIFPVRPIGY
jgi:hypothetical protein